jgi:hypothetical protein
MDANVIAANVNDATCCSTKAHSQVDGDAKGKCCGAGEVKAQTRKYPRDLIEAIYG